MTKCVVLFSGGLDSLAALIWARNSYGPENTLALYCHVGQRYAYKEITAVKKICERLDQKYVLDTRLDLEEFEKSKEQNSIIPYRNTFFILTASLYLPEEGGDVVLQNVIEGETSTIDRRKVFNKALEKFLPMADQRNVKIIAPHENLTKADICYWLRNNTDVENIIDTIGCYSEEDGNCGECNSCFRSWVALEWAGIRVAERFNKFPNKWKGIKKYIMDMKVGKYSLSRTSQTFSVLQRYGHDAKLTFAFDLDGVLAVETEEQRIAGINGDIKLLQSMYSVAKSNPFVVNSVRELHREGHTIIIHTARHKEDKKITERWLREQKIPYDRLVLCKPHADFYIDDRMLDMKVFLK